MDTIVIKNLEVRFRVGVPDEERAQPQPLAITVELDLDTHQAAATDDLAHTVDYFALSQKIKELGVNREWRLLEKLASDVATLAISSPRVQAARVEVRKFILPDTRYVAVRTEWLRQPDCGRFSRPVESMQKFDTFQDAARIAALWSSRATCVFVLIGAAALITDMLIEESLYSGRLLASGVAFTAAVTTACLWAMALLVGKVIKALNQRRAKNQIQHSGHPDRE